MSDASSVSGLERIVSGGQTGVDRGALDAAIAAGVPHGGWCPAGRLAEDGRIPDHYTLLETESPVYAVRTERNVLDSDGTLVLALGDPSGGTALTCRLAARHGRPCLVVDLNAPADPGRVTEWIARHALRVLNVAGPRESARPGLQRVAAEYVGSVLRALNTGGADAGRDRERADRRRGAPDR